MVECFRTNSKKSISFLNKNAYLYFYKFLMFLSCLKKNKWFTII